MTVCVELIYDGKAELGEGPVWHDNALWWVNILSGELNRLDITSGMNSSRALGGLLGVAVPTPGRNWIVACDRALYLVDWATGEIEDVATVEGDKTGNRFNDGKCDPAGRFWVGTMSLSCEPSAGSLFCLSHDMQVCKKIPRVTISNGLGWSPDGTQFFFVDTATQRIDALDFDVTSGTISNRRPFVEIPEEQGAPRWPYCRFTWKPVGRTLGWWCRSLLRWHHGWVAEENRSRHFLRDILLLRRT